jgi:hypothetical protein
LPATRHGGMMKPIPDLPGEFALIARYFAPLAKGFPGAYGLLDDAAVISPAPGHEFVAKTDAIVGGVDFPPDAPADLVARKALRVNLSDLAAKGAIPRAYMLDLMRPRRSPRPRRRGRRGAPSHRSHPARHRAIRPRADGRGRPRSRRTAGWPSSWRCRSCPSP